MTTKALDLPSCLAKTTKIPSQNIVIPGIDVTGHCIITGKTAKEIVNRLFGNSHATLFPPGFELPVAAHDIGKISPEYQERIY